MMFDDFQTHTVLSGGGGRLFAGVALIHVSQLHLLARDCLHGFSQLGYLLDPAH